jgi:hypothetical protein
MQLPIRPWCISRILSPFVKQTAHVSGLKNPLASAAPHLVSTSTSSAPPPTHPNATFLRASSPTLIVALLTESTTMRESPSTSDSRAAQGSAANHLVLPHRPPFGPPPSALCFPGGCLLHPCWSSFWSPHRSASAPPAALLTDKRHIPLRSASVQTPHLFHHGIPKVLVNPRSKGITSVRSTFTL